MQGALQPGHDGDHGQRFHCVVREKAGRTRRVLLALVRQERPDGDAWIVRSVIGGGADAGLGRRGDHQPSGEREAHELYERLLHRHLARGYRESGELLDTERWWLASWGFAVASIDPRLAPIAGAIYRASGAEQAKQLSARGWRPFGHPSGLSRVRRAFLLLDADGTPSLYGEAMAPEAFDPTSRELANRLARLDLAPCALEIGFGAGFDRALILFDVHQARGRSTADMSRAERGLLLDEIAASSAPDTPGSWLRRAVELRDPLAPCWLVAPDGGEARWIPG